MSTLNVKNIVGNPTSNLGTITSTSNAATFGNSVYFSANGNVGIGSVNPGNKLEVNGSGLFTSDTNNFVYILSDLGAMEISRSAGDSYIDFKNSAAEDFDVRLQSFGTDGTFSVSTSGGERLRITSAGNLQFNSGYGSVATAFGCRAWVNYNGTGTPAIRGSGNITSITDHGAGEWTVNFSSSMPDTNYGFVFGCQFPINGAQGTYIGNSTTTNPAVGSLRLVIIHAGAAYDSAYISVAIMR